MVIQKKRTVVLGASPNPMRYSYLAVNRLRANQHPVIAIGKRVGTVSDVSINTDHPHIDGVHTITLYLNANNQKQYYDYIMSLRPKRIIFNPGAENDELAKMAAREGIQAIEACTLVMLSTGQY
jgi:predicted CoA-binding protein